MSKDSPTAVIKLTDIRKDYPVGNDKITVLKNVNCEIHKNEFVSIVGDSGSGKSTLLYMMGLLISPTSGKCHIDGQEINSMSDKMISGVRASQIGFVFQSFHLIEQLSIYKNVLLGARYSATGVTSEHKEYAKELIDKVGLSHRLNHKPSQLSGGELQRTALARSLVTKPKIILADEPTGNLDTTNTRIIVDLLHQLHESEKSVIVMVTHNRSIAAEIPRNIEMCDGVLQNN